MIARQPEWNRLGGGREQRGEQPARALGSSAAARLGLGFQSGLVLALFGGFALAESRFPALIRNAVADSKDRITATVDSNGNLYGGDNQYGRTQKFVPKPGADPALLIRPPWVAR